ncbi:hypothetical protein niasHT_028942 [Heterodera trifolii]|uniref:Secreted protein n=1 Tax=Heterodera trifolii TaxID=157864 RepID=A0ABD2K145_9BILA
MMCCLMLRAIAAESATNITQSQRRKKRKNRKRNKIEGCAAAVITHSPFIHIHSSTPAFFGRPIFRLPPTAPLPPPAARPVAAVPVKVNHENSKQQQQQNNQLPTNMVMDMNTEHSTEW